MQEVISGVSGCLSACPTDSAEEQTRKKPISDILNTKNLKQIVHIKLILILLKIELLWNRFGVFSFFLWFKVGLSQYLGSPDLRPQKKNSSIFEMMVKLVEFLALVEVCEKTILDNLLFLVLICHQKMTEKIVLVIFPTISQKHPLHYL